ncbi:DUF948 domain-containing protein [Paenibacillus aurantius]|uniref:DUF948 domain-containing protein n=1 Tax=Paenibacillus aurantius TaxID=2918900 RepID=A0AA96LF86_9BACL|nr:DUF948 domain-containing protein [Paenibacillus aurantius]WNQ10532.1 DUF948 domain-containing protein [Paenibacillus aurantius]
MIWQISVAIIALAFAVLVFFLIRTLHTVQESLKDTNQTINQVQRELNDVSAEVKGLIRNTNQITMDVRTKMKALDSLFGTVENVGDTLEGVTSSLRQVSNRFRSNVTSNLAEVNQTEDKKVYKAINWASSIYDIWQRIKVYRMSKETARH